MTMRRRVLVLATVIVLSPSGCKGSKKAPESVVIDGATIVPLDVTPDDLVSAYSVNELSGDERYKGRLLFMSGSIIVVRTVDDRASLILDDAKTPGKGRAVEAYLAATETKRAARLQKGEKCSLLCTGDGGGGIGLPRVADCRFQ